jgi:4-hydroxyphenylpyruvate dioxygenase
MNTAVPTASHPNPGMQVTTFENPMGIDGFEFVEFAAPPAGPELHEYFRKMGFSAVLKHKQRPITVYRQGDVNFLVNEDPDSFAADFAEKHGPCACGFAIRFKKPGQEVYQTALGNGAEAIAFAGQQGGQRRSSRASATACCTWSTATAAPAASSTATTSRSPVPTCTRWASA